MTSIRILAAVALAGFVGMAAPAIAQGVPQNDNLNATLWMQRSVEYKGAALTAYALAKFRLDQALADKNWTGAPAEQKGSFQNLPPAIIVDLDETAIDNSGYQAWMVMKDTSFDPKTWNAYVKSVASLAVPGALDFMKYAESKGVKIFYVSNRTADEEAASRQNLEKLGFPMGGNVDVFLFARKQPDWGSAKGTRRAHIAKDHRVLLNLGDNFGDFVDEFRGGEAERLKVFEANRERWGREWIVLPNPTYGSFESAPFGHDFKKSQDERRDAKRKALEVWAGP